MDVFTLFNNGKLLRIKRYLPIAPFVEKIVYRYFVGMRQYYVFRMNDGRLVTVAVDKH